MRNLFEKVKRSQFYKKYIKHLKIMTALRKIRDWLRIVMDRTQGLLNPTKRIDNLLSILDKNLLPLQSTDNDRKQGGANCHFLGTMSETELALVKNAHIDVIVPIYNGYDYLIKLLPDLRKTEMKCTYILVDDQSSEERVSNLLDEYASQYADVVLLHNDKNYGFVKTVNRGLEYSSHHVALVNTDTELPYGWAERLMLPILKEAKVASTTPYTNSGTIFSFPRFIENNAIYHGSTVSQLDYYFAHIKPRYTKTPTGVGFCMGMNRDVIDRIGGLDEEAFERGYGEENDWCQRAIKRGYCNVHVENLFVYHKHGGSFQSEEKARLIKQHTEILNDRYPSYEYQVAKYVEKDAGYKLRRLMQMVISTHEKKSILLFSHNLGGGADRYVEMQKRKMLDDNQCVTIIRYIPKKKRYQIVFTEGTYEQEYSLKNTEDICGIAKWLHFDEIIINELIEYPKLWQVLDTIVQLKQSQNIRLIMLFHDYYAICPSVNLTQLDGTYCMEQSGEGCEQCFREYGYDKEFDCMGMADWRNHWRTFLLQCDEIRCFSEDTLKRVQRIYGGELAYTLVPHVVDYMFPIRKHTKTTDTINIGILGVLSKHKGGDVVRQMLRVIEEQQLNARIILIGAMDDIEIKPSPYFAYTGSYHVSELPHLIYENDIDLFFITSIWPETFSYTSEEIMKMQMPIVAFDLGAPAERIRKYEQGLLLELHTEAEVIVEKILAFARQGHIQEQRTTYPTILYISEYQSFSSRYRLLHLKEEMLIRGVPGIVYEEKYPKDIDWSDVGALCVYRCRYQNEVKRVMEEAKAHHIPITYDIDDNIFDYEHMDYVPEIDEEVYGDFEMYSQSLRQCMEQADRVMVSTNHMAEAVRNCFPDKEVYINRNVASLQMCVLSALAVSERTDHEKITIGYFSGSNTHNDDFELISPVLLEVLKKYDNVQLKIVGCLELSKEYDAVSERILRTEMLPWQKLPAEIASVDINLMPLQDSFFHCCKSENKWMEAAWVRVPTVASYNDEIAGVTHPGEDIILCKTQDEWREAIENLICDKNLRERIARTAYEEVRKCKSTLCADAKLVDYILGEK